MTCPNCGGDTKVIDSRPNIDHVIRRRKCRECGHCFYTIETDVDMNSKLKKGDTYND